MSEPHPLKVLIVEDDEDDYIIIRELFAEVQDPKFMVDWVPSYKAALEAVNLNRHDLYLFDYRLGEKTGLDLLRETIHVGRRKPVIVLTGQGDLDIDVQAMKTGAADYLVKGEISASLLSRSIRYAVEQRRTKNELEDSYKGLEKKIEEKTVELKRSLKELKDQEYALDISTSVTRTDVDGKITYVNDNFCRISKYAPEDLIGRDHRIMNSGLHPKEYFQKMWTAIKSGRVWKGEVRNKAKDGPHFWLDSTIVPILDEQGEPCQFISIRSDITQNKELEERLKAANAELTSNLKITQDLTEKYDKARQLAEVAAKAKSTFLANMSHEIRTPMNAIVGFCDLLQKTPLDHAQKDYVHVLKSSGELLCSVINGILDFSKLESGHMTLEAIDFDMRYLIKNILAIATTRINKRTIRTYVDIEKDLPPYFKGDPTKLRQVLLNLVSNALKFTSQGEIRVIVRKEAGSPGGGMALRFTVKDTGVGIAPDSLKHIFQPFQQADTSTTRKYGGTGLGLTISKSIVELMGGKIWVVSQVGKGSEFSFIVKLREGESVVQKEIYPLLPAKLAGVKVLIVDDNQISRKILTQFCESWKMEILAVERTGPGALEALNKLHRQKNTPALILSDVRMEGMSGYELVEKIRADKQYKDIKIITVSSEASSGEARNAQAKGFDGYLPKPIEHLELLKVIVTVLGDKRKGGSIVTQHMANEVGCKGIKVLIAEDNKPNQMLMREYCKLLGCESDFAHNGQEAINKLKEGHVYDLILMDLHMPVLGGLESTAVIRKEVNKDIPIIALTAAVLEEDRKNAEAVGINDFLSKPINIDDLREKIIQYGRV
ncbi:MAG: hypothetical protein A3C36_05295 [Omnitrophica WOR_2 bacterium RIFCSPHIGHO2_02_FULL_52_10]|nr:MAG: hypothetical protein A3C36_05295 [Omnitrophica WOR_2 bacterium RIFCSPHIGHO2_02_FULL_52_10]